MRFLVQRVTHASVEVDQHTIGEIQKGFLVLIGISQEDTKEIADKMIRKLIALRIFEDQNGKTNLSLADVSGELLFISQFIKAGSPDYANEMYEYIIAQCREQIPVVQTGSFGADMKISLLNDGPFTIMLDSSEICS